MPKLNSVILFALVLLIVTSLIFLPSFSFDFTTLYNEKRILQGAVLVLGAIFLFIILFKKQLNISRKTASSFFLLSIFLFISISFSDHPTWAFFEISWYILLVQLALVLGYVYQKFPVYFERILLLTIICMVGIYSIRVLGDVSTTLFRDDWPVWPNRSRFSVIMGGERLVPNGFLGFGNIRYFNHIQTWTLPLLAYAYIFFSRDTEKYLKNVIAVLLSIWFMIAFASGARGTLLAVILSLIPIVIIFKKENYMKWIRVFLITLCAGLLLYLFIFHVLIPFGSGKPLTRYDSSNRYDLWIVTLKTIVENPFSGVGPMHLANINGSNPLTSPHSIYLMWIAEWGIPAFLVFVYIIFDHLKNWIKQVVEKPSVKKVAITAALFAGTIHSGVSGLLITPLSQLIFVILLGWIIGLSFTQRGEQIFENRRSRLKYAFISILLLINLFAFYKFINDIPRLEENSEKFQTLYRNEQLNIFPVTISNLFPRFWEQGFIGLEEKDN